MIGTILLRELKVIARQRSTLILLILMPAVLITILGFALSGTMSVQATWTDAFDIAVVKQYEEMTPMEALEKIAPSKEAFQFIAMQGEEQINAMNPEAWFFDEFLSNEEVKKMVNYTIMDADAAVEAAKAGDVRAIVVLGENFITSGVGNFFFDGMEPATIDVKSTSEQSFSYKIVVSMMEGYSQLINENRARATTVRAATQGLSPEAIGQVIQKTMALEEASVDVETTSIKERPTLSSFQYYAAAIMAMFIFYGAGIAGVRLLSEQREHTWQRQIAAGIKPSQLLTASVLLGIIIAVVQMTVLIVLSALVFKVNWGNPITVAVSVLSAAIAMGGINLFLATLTLRTGSFQMINTFRGLLIQVFALLGGSYLPIEMLPAIFQKLSFFTLNGLAIKAWTRTMQGYGLSELATVIGGMWLIAVIFLVLGIIYYPRKRGAVRV